MTPRSSRHADRRTATRHPLKLKVEIDGTTGTTENVSAEGILLTTDSETAVGTELTLDLRLPALVGPSGGGLIRVKGTVVRVEEQEGHRVVAAQFVEWTVLDPE